MTTKYTLLTLCEEYDKIEIPRIQRNYAQGRENQIELRNRFVDYLVDSLESRTAIELDFVYGNVREDLLDDNQGIIKTFIPIDGQQRLTTLWLLHWFLAVREKRLSELSPILSRFTYETRPDAHAFCQRLMTGSFPSDKIRNIDRFITNQTWFDDDWMNDGTVRGMLRMLMTFEQKSALTEGQVTLDMLMEPQNLLSFYFVPLEQFGLSEDLYIRMNARGKILTNFENFKSEFYKIIQNSPMLEQVKDKMEYQWVTNLWEYRDKSSFVIDDNFMHYLKFITRQIYFSEAKSRDSHGYEQDFLNLTLLKTIYSSDEHVRFLIFAFDSIPKISQLKTNNLFGEKNNALCDLLSKIIKGEYLLSDGLIIIYATLLFLYKHPQVSTDKITDFIRVIRNLICNTYDSSERELPRILRSIDKLSQETDIYSYAAKTKFNIEGFRNSQCEEEHFKALVITKIAGAKELLFQIEDDTDLCGNIRCLIAGSYMKTESDIKEFNFSDKLSDSFQIDRLKCLYNRYRTLKNDDFDEIWGDLLNSSLYQHTEYSRMMFYEGYQKNEAIIEFCVSFMDSPYDDLQKYIIHREKNTILKILKNTPDLSTVRDVKVQLYLLYVLTRRIMDLGYEDFFRNGYNIGWLAKENGFTSLFKCGMDDEKEFDKVNPIFQTYKQQFRYSWGLNKNHAMPCEIVGRGKTNRLLEKLADWAHTK